MLFLDWWAKRRRRIKEDELKEYLCKNLPFLFSEWAAKFVPNEEYSSKYHGIFATIEIGHLRLRASSFRDEFYIDIAPAQAPKDWEDLVTVLKALQAKGPINSVEDITCMTTYLPISSLAALLKQHLAGLQEGFSVPNYAVTWRTIQTIKQVEREEYNRQMWKGVHEARNNVEKPSQDEAPSL
jgi:hypothetical protein